MQLEIIEQMVTSGNCISKFERGRSVLNGVITDNWNIFQILRTKWMEKYTNYKINDKDIVSFIALQI